MKKYTLQECIDNDIVIHCKTEEEAEAYCKAMHELGRTWNSQYGYLDKTMWGIVGESTCYQPKWDDWDDWHAYYENKIITFDQLDLEVQHDNWEVPSIRADLITKPKPKKFMKVVGLISRQENEMYDRAFYQCEECGIGWLGEVRVEKHIPPIICNCQKNNK